MSQFAVESATRTAETLWEGYRKSVNDYRADTGQNADWSVPPWSELTAGQQRVFMTAMVDLVLMPLSNLPETVLRLPT